MLPRPPVGVSARAVRVAVSCAAFAALLGVLACDVGTGTLTTPIADVTVPAALVREAGDGQRGTVGTTLPTAIAVRVLAANGDPVADVPVTFVADNGGLAGEASSTVVRTDAAGRARISWTLGTRATVQHLTVSAGMLPLTQVVALAAAGTVTRLVITDGDGQSAMVGTPVATPPLVLAIDAYGNAVPGATVRFSIAGGGGQLVGDPTATTNSNGIAAPTLWVLGPTVGENLLIASSGTTTTVAHAAATARPIDASTLPASLSLITGSAQVGTVGQPIPTSPVIQVRDARGRPVNGVRLAFSIARGGGRLSGTSIATTDTLGLATTPAWTLGSQPGANDVSVAVIPSSGAAAPVTPLTITATAVTGPAARLAIAGGSGGSAATGALVGTPTVRLTDALDNPIVGATVVFSVTKGGGSLLGTIAITDANGVASAGAWKLGPAGEQEATATSNGIIVTFTATAK